MVRDMPNVSAVDMSNRLGQKYKTSESVWLAIATICGRFGTIPSRVIVG
jgi:hypothetical protein